MHICVRLDSENYGSIELWKNFFIEMGFTLAAPIDNILHNFREDYLHIIYILSK